MTKEQFELSLKEITEEYLCKKEQLQEQFALSNNSYKVGDVFRDHIGKIKILTIDWAMPHDGPPCCVFDGVELKADGYPKKNGSERRAWQCNEQK